MSGFIEAPTVFKHHQPISLEMMQGYTIMGNNGAFKDLVTNCGGDPKSPTVGVGVMIKTRGDIMGTKLLLCGLMPETKMNTSDLFPEAPDHGKAVFQKTDIGNWLMPSGRLTSLWSRREDNSLNWSIKMISGGRSKTIKFPKHRDYGFGDAVFRLNIQPSSVQNMKVTMELAPVGGDELEKLVEYNSRKFPTVQMGDVRARIFPPEAEGQNLGLGFNPVIIVTDAGPGEMDIDSINFPSSMAVKEAAVSLLQSSTKPNSRINAEKWSEAVNNQEFQTERTSILWPGPREEDDVATSDSTASVDTDGEKNKITKKYIYFDIIITRNI